MSKTDDERRAGEKQGEATAELLPVPDEVLEEVAGGVAVRLPIDPNEFFASPLRAGYQRARHPKRDL